MSSSKRARRRRYRRNQEAFRKFAKGVARKIGVPLRVFVGDVNKSLASYVKECLVEYERRLREGMKKLMEGWMNNPGAGLFRPYKEGGYTTMVNYTPAGFKGMEDQSGVVLPLGPSVLPPSEWKGKPPESRQEV